MNVVELIMLYSLIQYIAFHYGSLVQMKECLL